MKGDDLKRFRERRGLERSELADALNAALDSKYDAESIARWERGNRNPSRKVTAFLETLQMQGGILGGDPPAGAGDDLGPEGTSPPSPADGPEDSAPGPGPALVPEPQAGLGSGGLYARACEELWEMIAAGVGMIGAATGNHALMVDGEILAGDKAALGQAWGKLAETNETFRRMLVGMTEGGAWLSVAMVTGTTVSKCWQNHVAIAESRIAYPDLHHPDAVVGEPAAA